MKYTNETEILRALDIPSWRHLSKPKFLEFLAFVPEIDREVALAIIGQLPVFRKLARGLMVEVAEAFESAIASNDRSQTSVHEVALERLAILKAQLDKDLTPEERLRVSDDLRDVHQQASAKDTENKEFLAAQFDKIVFVATGVIVLALVFVGVKFSLKSRGE